MDFNSTWNCLGLVEIGDGGTGEVNVTLGGKVLSDDAEIGSISPGEVNVDGFGSKWDSSGSLTIGALGSGTLNITNQGVVENTSGLIGDASFGGSEGNGTVNVSGAGSRWTNTGQLIVGNAGTGTLSISAGGTVQNTETYLGLESGGTGMVTVDGAGSLWDNSRDVSVGYAGDGTLSITSGGKVQSVEGAIGRESGSTGHVTVDGAGSRWEYSGNVTMGETAADLTVGGQGDGTLEITDGGQLIGTAPSGDVRASIGAEAGSTGVVRVTGQSSLWDVSSNPTAGGYLNVGDDGNGTLEITGGGIVRANNFFIGNASTSAGHVTVDGNGSLADVSNVLFVVCEGNGTLEITGGGRVQSDGGYISGPAASPSAVTVSGPGSRWDMSGFVNVGFSDATRPLARVGTLDITAGGHVTAIGSANLGTFDGTTGIVTVAGADSTLEVDGSLLIGNDILANPGSGTLRVQAGATVTVTQDTLISAGGFLSLEGGTLSTTAINFSNGANVNMDFAWTSGTLHVGLFDGDLVNQAGVLAPGNSAGVTFINGDYNQLADATLQVEIGGIINGNQYDFAYTLDNAFLGGDLELALINGFIPNATDTFQVFDAGLNLFGAFANVTNGQRLTTTDGLGSFVVNYGAGSAFDPSQIVLSNFLAGLPGDFDFDGDVDGRDFLIWQRGGSLVPLSAGDLAAWQANYGAGPLASEISVPEPGTLPLWALNVALLFIVQRKHPVQFNLPGHFSWGGVACYRILVRGLVTLRSQCLVY